MRSTDDIQFFVCRSRIVPEPPFPSQGIAGSGNEIDICKVTRSSKLLAVGKMCRKLYMLKVIPSNEEVNDAKEDPNLHLGTVTLVT